MNDTPSGSTCLYPAGLGFVEYWRLTHISFFSRQQTLVTDRLKELIKVRGYQVPPAELEALILKHDAVADVAVIQVEDEVSGELPRAYIVLKEFEVDIVTEKDIYEWVKAQVAAYKRLDGGVIFTDIIPKSASGKILRRILRDQLKEEMKR